MKSKKNSFPICWLFLYWLLLHAPREALAQSTMFGNSPTAIEINGITLHYVEAGKGSPVVFVHGSFGDYRTWHYQMEPFAKHYRAISYSRRYYFPNNPPTSSSTPSSRLDVEDLVAFIQELDAGPVHLIGQSSGAYIAMIVAIKHPDLIKDLVLGEPPVWELTAEDSLGLVLMKKAMTETFAPAVKAFRKNQDRKAARIFLDGVVGENHFMESLPPADRKIMSDEIATEKSIFLSDGDVQYQQPFTEADIRNIAVPVLLVSGANTPLWLSHLTDRLEECLQNKERVVLANTSHGLAFTSPEAFNKAVLQFIDGQEKESK